MYLVLLKNDKRVTSLVVGVHGDDLQAVEQYAKANFEYDNAVEMNEKEHAQMLENEAKANEPTEQEKELYAQLAEIEAEAKELEEAVEEIKSAYVLASIANDEAEKEELKQEYKKLTGYALGD